MYSNNYVNTSETIRSARVAGGRTIATFAGTSERFLTIRCAQGLIVVPSAMVRCRHLAAYIDGFKRTAHDGKLAHCLQNARARIVATR